MAMAHWLVVLLVPNNRVLIQFRKNLEKLERDIFLAKKSKKTWKSQKYSEYIILLREVSVISVHKYFSVLMF